MSVFQQLFGVSGDTFTQRAYETGGETLLARPLLIE
jgi:hypothetical protein